jgi:hypothetical protein
MAKADPAPVATPDDSSKWETVQVGLGREWDFDRDGALVGNFLGTAIVDTDKVESGHATAYRFAAAGSGEEVFVWGSSEIVNAFSRLIPDTETPIIAIGDKVKVEYLGRDQFTGPKGPQQIKRYRVQIPKAGSSRRKAGSSRS